LEKSIYIDIYEDFWFLNTGLSGIEGDYRISLFKETVGVPVIQVEKALGFRTSTFPVLENVCKESGRQLSTEILVHPLFEKGIQHAKSLEYCCPDADFRKQKEIAFWGRQEALIGALRDKFFYRHAAELGAYDVLAKNNVYNYFFDYANKVIADGEYLYDLHAKASGGKGLREEYGQGVFSLHAQVPLNIMESYLDSRDDLYLQAKGYAVGRVREEEERRMRTAREECEKMLFER
jgi:hypothetical protein